MVPDATGAAAVLPTADELPIEKLTAVEANDGGRATCWSCCKLELAAVNAVVAATAEVVNDAACGRRTTRERERK